MIDDSGLAAWSRAHAVAMLAGCAVAAASGQAWPLALVALLSVGWLLRRARGAFTPRPGFGWANAVTALRLALALALGSLGPTTPGWVLAALLGAASALDGADGWLARRFGLASAFGATFDIETDAVMTLLATLQLWQRGRLGAWVLVPGLLRYAYVLALAVFPPRAGHVPSSRFARRAFLALIIGLLAALVGDGVAGGVVGTALAAIGSAAVAVSFARSFLWSYRAR